MYGDRGLHLVQMMTGISIISQPKLHDSNILMCNFSYSYCTKRVMEHKGAPK